MPKSKKTITVPSNISFLYKTVDILPEYLEKILDGSKKLEFRSWYSEAPYFLLKNTKTKKVEAVIRIAHVLDMDNLDEESKETVLDEGKVSEEFREKYNCKYCYMIDKIHRIH